MGCLHMDAEIPVQAEEGLWGAIPDPKHLTSIIRVLRQTRQMKGYIENQERWSELPREDRSSRDVQDEGNVLPAWSCCQGELICIRESRAQGQPCTGTRGPAMATSHRQHIQKPTGTGGKKGVCEC